MGPPAVGCPALGDLAAPTLVGRPSWGSAARRVPRGDGQAYGGCRPTTCVRVVGGCWGTTGYQLLCHHARAGHWALAVDLYPLRWCLTWSRPGDPCVTLTILVSLAFLSFSSTCRLPGPRHLSSCFSLAPLVCLSVSALSDYLFKLLLIGDSSVGYVSPRSPVCLCVRRLRLVFGAVPLWHVCAVLLLTDATC